MFLLSRDSLQYPMKPEYFNQPNSVKFTVVPHLTYDLFHTSLSRRQETVLPPAHCPTMDLVLELGHTSDRDSWILAALAAVLH